MSGTRRGGCFAGGRSRRPRQRSCRREHFLDGTARQPAQRAPARRGDHRLRSGSSSAPLRPSWRSPRSRRGRSRGRSCRHRRHVAGGLDDCARPTPAGLGRLCGRPARDRARRPRHLLEHRQSQSGVRRNARRADVRPCDAAHLRRDGRNLLRAEWRREHRARGDDADGRLLGHLRRGQGRHVGSWPPRGCSRRWAHRARVRLLRHPAARPTRSSAGRVSTSFPSG